jgi:gluconate 2-dehydrogenase gamma chain
MKRRHFIALPIATLPLAYRFAQATEVKVPLLYFTEAEALAVKAACARIFPKDESGPGATEAGVVVYIDRQLAGPWGKDKYRYTKGPWVESVSEHGYQGKETPQQLYRAGVKGLGEDFATLAAAEQDRRLKAIEKTTFFKLLRTHTLEGMFSDPLHGGNAGMVGWQMVGYPGPVMSHRDEIDKHDGVAYRVKPKSLTQITGHPVKGWEEEG